MRKFYFRYCIYVVLMSKTYKKCVLGHKVIWYASVNYHKIYSKDTES